MNKQEFLNKLRDGLRKLPNEEIEERLFFYSEMIDDRIEEGLSEDDAVENVGAVDDIVKQIISEMPFSKLVINKIKPKRKLNVSELVLIILGSPIWLAILITLIAVVIAIYISIWAVIVALWASFASIIACGFSGSIIGLIYVFTNNAVTGLFLISAALVLFGLGIFFYYGCKYITKWLILLTKKAIFTFKKSLIRRENA